MLKIGVQTKNIIDDKNPMEGFLLLKDAGFSSVDFSLNAYLSNTDLYEGKRNQFFDQSVEELKTYFSPLKNVALDCGIEIFQMHMPYPLYIPTGDKEINDYLWNVVAPQSMHICHYLGCKNIVVHGFKARKFLGSEELEWEKTECFLEYLAPLAKEFGITLCVENLYTSIGGHLIEGPCCDAYKAVERIDRINEKYGAEVIGFCFDTGHANLVGINFEEFITVLGHRLKVLHVHDNDGIADLHQIPFTFTKTRENLPSTDWNGFVKGLQNIGYAGAISFETAPVLSSFPKKMKKEVLQFIAKIGRYFVNEIE